MANEEIISLKKINGRMFIDLIVESTTTIVDLLPLPDGSTSPAQSCGLRVGDTIVAIGGVSVVGKDASFITGRFKGAGDVVELRVQHKLSGSEAAQGDSDGDSQPFQTIWISTVCGHKR